MGESAPINLSIQMVRQHFVTPTKSGAVPTDAQLAKFVMLCKTQLLNPWAGDAFISGYDTKNGPGFTLLVAIQALLKRAERCQAFDGIESGIIVTNADGEVTERSGDLLLPKEQLIGSWAKVYRKDRRIPFYRVCNRAAYDQQRSRWLTDPNGMLRKCAQAGALREAFPVELSGMHVDGEPAAQEYQDVSLPKGLQAVVEETQRRREEPEEMTEQGQQQHHDECSDAADPLCVFRSDLKNTAVSGNRARKLAAFVAANPDLQSAAEQIAQEIDFEADTKAKSA